MSQPILKIQDLTKTYKVSKIFGANQYIQALRGITLELEPEETLAIVGESGCGKSTLAKSLMKLEAPTSGSIQLFERDHATLKSTELPDLIQMIFQDPYSSINPRKKIWQIIGEPLAVRGVPTAEIRTQVEAITLKVGLRPELLERYPHMLSGGQRQRVGIARALVTRPKILVCDEPVSALDVSVQAQVLNLLLDLQKEQKLTYLFISHDLGVVRFLADRVAVMYLGRIVELSPVKNLFNKPLHPYTQLLLQSSPVMSQKVSQESIEASELPSPLNPPSGCGFHTRCPFATAQCKTDVPQLRTYQGAQVACHNVEKI